MLIKSIFGDRLSLKTSGKDDEFDKSNDSGVDSENIASDRRANILSKR